MINYKNFLKFIIGFVIVALLPGVLHAVELMGPIRNGDVPVMNEANVLNLRGMKFELYPERRVVSTVFNGSKIKVQLNTHSSSDGFDVSSQGVIFNHAYQKFGSISGEIAFSMIDGSLVSSKLSSLNGFKKLGTLNLYAVYARSPAEFKNYIELLSADKGVNFIEPTVDYSIVQ